MTGVGYTDWHCTPCFRYPCGYLPTPPSPPAWKRCIYISIRSSFDPPRTRATTLPASLRTLIAPPSSAAFFSTRRRCLADLLFAWMIKFIRPSIEIGRSVRLYCTLPCTTNLDQEIYRRDRFETFLKRCCLTDPSFLFVNLLKFIRPCWNWTRGTHCITIIL